jgi:release factor glutamine methyltransferase
MKNQEIAWLLHEKYQGVENADFQADCDKLAAGVPLAYIIGQVPFLDCTIYLDSHPLIPRPETEYWVERVVTKIKKQITSNLSGSTPKILDLCAGSGAIGVAVAKAIPEASVTFIELDPAHLPTIKKNVIKNTIKYNSEKYQVQVSDLFAELSEDEKFDYILTNPPYIDAEANTADDNVVEHEPHLALFGGEAGMELITRSITEARQHLTPTGQLWIEHEPAQVKAIETVAKIHDFSIITHPDQYGVPRFSVLSMAQ